MTWLTTRATPAALSALPDASLHLRLPPGGGSRQSAAVTAIRNGMLACSTPLKNEPTQWWWSETP